MTPRLARTHRNTFQHFSAARRADFIPPPLSLLTYLFPFIAFFTFLALFFSLEARFLILFSPFSIFSYAPPLGSRCCFSELIFFNCSPLSANISHLYFFLRVFNFVFFFFATPYLCVPPFISSSSYSLRLCSPSFRTSLILLFMQYICRIFFTLEFPLLYIPSDFYPLLLS